MINTATTVVVCILFGFVSALLFLIPFGVAYYLMLRALTRELMRVYGENINLHGTVAVWSTKIQQLQEKAADDEDDDYNAG